ncbi:MAG: transporter substrate-binding protein [Betaproteobacteria bacterium]|jgi:4,5-dihydroxyphthalate decarboxylase|nr:transporter substrate-binding protein [Betaproteobacteria bacterium]MEA3156016.1 4,5-dihydroxyphthalate decarboxylase [Betaproteobacteria bacterium]
MSKLRLTLSCWAYDRMRALADGRVQPDGIDLNFLDLPVEETFFRMLRNREFDVAELSLSSYTVSLFREPRPFVAIPVFPSRMFRHSCIFVSTKSGIREPEDLAGKRIGTPEYQMTAPVWIRGILQDEYGVNVESCEYFTGGQEEPGREEKLKLDLPPQIKVRPIGPEKTLSQMLAAGEIDALHSPRMPSTLHTQPDKVKRLFEPYIDVERAYYRKTRIFPIMHAIAIKREVYERNPWIAMSLYKAFVQSQKIAYDELYETAALRTMLPWMIAEIEDVRRDMGHDWWPYGFGRNRAGLDTFLRYHHEQGLSKHRLEPETLFAPETMEAFKI